MAESGNGRPLEVRVAIVEERVKHCEERVDSMSRTLDQVNSKLTGVLAAVAASAIMLALNLIVNGWTP